MTPEEMVAAMADKAEFDDAFINEFAAKFAALDIDGMKRFMTCFNERQGAFTEDQKHNISKINHALAKVDDFAKAMRAWHEWKMAQAAKAEDGP